MQYPKEIKTANIKLETRHPVFRPDTPRTLTGCHVISSSFPSRSHDVCDRVKLDTTRQLDGYNYQSVPENNH